MSDDRNALAVLMDIDATLKALLALSKARTAKAHPLVASDADLDGQYGDLVIKAKDPRDWSGETMVGRHLSECPADYLSILADRYDFFAQGETDPKKARYNALDAARCRGWAARIRSGWKPPQSSLPVDEGAPVSEGDIQW